VSDPEGFYYRTQILYLLKCPRDAAEIDWLGQSSATCSAILFLQNWVWYQAVRI